MPSLNAYRSWGRYPKSRHRDVLRLTHRDRALPTDNGMLLPFGNGRSYGDSCLNSDGVLLDVRGLDRFIEFDREKGRIQCEAGVLLSQVLALIVGSGWFLPVTPGTRYVTVGGAIANDVHGKNHHVAGTFGHHVNSFELLRSDGQRLVCNPLENEGLFAATIGGLGLTGLITWVDFDLKPIGSPQVLVDTVRFDNVDGFFELALRSDLEHEYTVAWVDCLARGGELGRGVYISGNHAPSQANGSPRAPSRRLSMPFDPPISLVSNATLRAFNSVYYRKPVSRGAPQIQHYAQFFYPLDSVANWNRIYGPKGFLQYQSVVPMAAAHDATRAMLERIAHSGQGSFLSILKLFGCRPSRGMLSFPREGVTLALDFPFRGEATLGLLDDLDSIVLEAGGAVYPAKDARMSPELFAAGYPKADAFQHYIDPLFSSSLWRRVRGGAG